MATRTYQTRMRTLPDGEWRDVTVTEYPTFAEMPGWEDLPTIPADEIVYLKDLTPARGEAAQDHDHGPAEGVGEAAGEATAGESGCLMAR